MKQEKHEIRCSEIEKHLGKCCFFKKSYKNTRTKKRVIRTDGPLFGTSERTRKGGGRAADAKNMPVACFLARGRVPGFLGAPRRGVDKNPAPASCGGPVDCRQTPTRRRLLHSVPRPFWRIALMPATWGAGQNANAAIKTSSTREAKVHSVDKLTFSRYNRRRTFNDPLCTERMRAVYRRTFLCFAQNANAPV